MYLFDRTNIIHLHCVFLLSNGLQRNARSVNLDVEPKHLWILVIWS